MGSHRVGVASWLISRSGVRVRVRDLVVGWFSSESAGLIEQIGHVDLLDVFEANLVEMAGIEKRIRGFCRRFDGQNARILGWRYFARGQWGGLRCKGLEFEQIFLDIEEPEPLIKLATIGWVNPRRATWRASVGPRLRSMIFDQ